MAVKVDTQPTPVSLLDNRWLSEPALVLIGYLLLALLVDWSDESFWRVVLAGVLALFGTGYSLVTTMFPYSTGFDVVERLALAASLSVAVGGVLGFLLARFGGGFHLGPFLAAMALLNLACYLAVWYQRRLVAAPSPVVSAYIIIAAWWTGQETSGRLTTAVLIALLVGGAWAIGHPALAVDPEPAMTEFYLLNASGQAEAYPETLRAGELLVITYGIVNREKETVQYQVQVIAEGQLLAGSEPVRLTAGERVEEQFEILLPARMAGPTKIEFVLYRGDRIPFRYRTLHLPITVASVKSDASSRTTTGLEQNG